MADLKRQFTELLNKVDGFDQLMGLTDVIT